MTIQRTKQIQQTKEDGKTHKPVLGKWKGEPMVLNHSLRATVKEILNVREDLDVVKLGIIGEESTGKTTLSLTLGHLIHKMSDIPFSVRLFGEADFLDFKRTLAGLEAANYVLIFDDISFINDKKAIELLKNAVTKIRHLPGGTDVKIILIYNYHYTLGLDKYLRQSHFKYFTSLGSSEKENMINICGTKYTNLIEDFIKKYMEMITKHKCTFRIGPKKFFIYPRKKPFSNCLFWNNIRLRYTLYPIREWIDPICSICAAAKGTLLHSEIPIDQYKKECEEKFGVGTFLSAVKLKLIMSGVNVYSASVQRALKYLERSMETKIISIEELGTSYGLETKRVRLRKKLDGVLTAKS